jgi:hypothetical protein
MKVQMLVLIVGLASLSAYAEDAPKECPSFSLCPELVRLTRECEENKKSPACDSFVETYRKLAPRYTCKRSFDTDPVPAIWLCDQGAGSPGPHEKALRLLSKLKSKKARAFFGSSELRLTLDGALAEEFESKSVAVGKRSKR